MTLDLSSAMLLAGIRVELLWNPPVRKSGSDPASASGRTTAALGESGAAALLRDYCQALPPSRLSLRKRLDLGVFFFIHYALPVIGAFDWVNRPADPLPARPLTSGP